MKKEYVKKFKEKQRKPYKVQKIYLCKTEKLKKRF